MICRACGKEIEDGETFCYYCGESFEDVGAQDTEYIGEATVMKCPECGRAMKKGFVEVVDLTHPIVPMVAVSFCPNEDKGKIIRKHAISLKLNAEGYYCDKCEKVVAIFEKD